MQKVVIMPNLVKSSPAPRRILGFWEARGRYAVAPADLWGTWWDRYSFQAVLSWTQNGPV